MSHNVIPANAGIQVSQAVAVHQETALHGFTPSAVSLQLSAKKYGYEPI
jgi:hypothetical protein